MKRLELFEFEDFPWLPTFVRAGVTNLIEVFHRILGTSNIVSTLIMQAHRQQAFDQVVDMGSGSGGTMPQVMAKVNETRPQDPIQLLLTDAYPDLKVVERINSQSPPYIRYLDTPLDARNIADAPAGLKTMMASFHHLHPTIAKDLLRSAEQHGESILIYELAKNNIPVLLWWLLLPLSLSILILMTLIMTPFVKGLSFTQVVFTYVIPIIPLVYAWDGQASLMRTYTFKDIEQLLGERANPQYVWEISDAQKTNGKTAGYYIWGYPKTL